MSSHLDLELAAALTTLTGGAESAPSPELGDWQTIRDVTEATCAALATLVPKRPKITRTDYRATSADGTTVKLRWFSSDDMRRGPAVVHAHGGGMIAGTVELFDPWIAYYAAESGVPILSVDYRRAPEARGTALAQDLYAGLTWLIENAAELGVEPARIALMGESAGGGIAAGAAILARDNNVTLAKQILIYPMLDDRNITPDPQLASFATWTWSYTNNHTGWSTLLGDQFGTNTVSPVAAPARLKDAAGLASTYIEVGDLDIFRDEDVAYSDQLKRAGVIVQLIVRPGLNHGFDLFAPEAAATRRAMEDRLGVIRAL